MTSERRKALDDLGFDWGNDERWMIMYEGLKNFKDTYGHFDVPRNYKVKGFSLFHWLEKQRVKYSRSEKIRKPLTDEQYQLLKEINFHFNVDEKWEYVLEQFIDYKNKTGKVTVSRSNDKKLAYWIARQRKYYRENKLSEEKIEKLLSAGFKDSRAILPGNGAEQSIIFWCL